MESSTHRASYRCSRACKREQLHGLRRHRGLRIQHCHHKAITTRAVSRIEAVIRVVERRNSPKGVAAARTPSMCCALTIVVAPFMALRNDGWSSSEFRNRTVAPLGRDELSSAPLQYGLAWRGTT